MLGGPDKGNPLDMLAKGGIFEQLDDDANLPEELEAEDDVKEQFHEENACEFCQVVFNKLKGKNRHHCRRCKKSVCDACSTNRRRLAKSSDKTFRVCDFCDTQLSNYKLE